MSAAKLPQPPPSAAVFTLRSSLLTLAILTLAVGDADVDHVDKVVVSEKDRDQSDDGDDDNDVYHLPKVFRLNYEEMLRRFKVYIYSDGDPNTYYQTPRKLTGKYSSEGYFFQNLRESNFVTDDPDRADLFFIPISCHKMRGKGISYENMTIIVQNYVESLMFKYPYWNRTLGADHFFVTCHDVGVRATEGLPNLVKNSIRVVCSPSYDVGFIPHKDVALPQVLQPFALPAGGNDIENRLAYSLLGKRRNGHLQWLSSRSNISLKLSEVKAILALSQDNLGNLRTDVYAMLERLVLQTDDVTYYQLDVTKLPTTLGFWAGHRNSKIRVILARVWENDTELDISNNRINRASGHLVYQKRFYRTKFCICPGGSQVNSARIADSIHYGCIPVILSNYYDLPFNDIINWHKFSVVLKEKDVYRLKQILKNKTQEEFVTLHNNLVKTPARAAEVGAAAWDLRSYRCGRQHGEEDSKEMVTSEMVPFRPIGDQTFSIFRRPTLLRFSRGSFFE
ncbi:hypothetical protein DH2020_040393 [Rehmannia glutinosa]|uniref:Exostosin GT47 domain-containing protein n=1 Tax=Rehmannia glutinosa TaxID=99300 RepID=A0ABR0UTA1_REHGL